MNLNCLELLVLLTAGAVAPYVFVALVTWLQQLGRHAFGAGAPRWVRLPRLSLKRKGASRCPA